jgi:hypothetical protein
LVHDSHSLIPEVQSDALPWPQAFLTPYRKRGAQLADASMVYLAERKGIDTVFSLDWPDFAVYRYGKNKPLTLIPGPGQSASAFRPSLLTTPRSLAWHAKAAAVPGKRKNRKRCPGKIIAWMLASTTAEIGSARGAVAPTRGL